MTPLPLFAGVGNQELGPCPGCSREINLYEVAMCEDCHIAEFVQRINVGTDPLIRARLNRALEEIGYFPPREASATKDVCPFNECNHSNNRSNQTTTNSIEQ